MWSDDPIRDYEEKCRQDEKWLKSRPVCAECGEPIQEEMATYINGEWYCDGCLRNMRRYIA